MIIYIHGDDTFRSRQYLKEQVEKFKIARDPQGYNVIFLDASKVEPSRVLSEIMSVPFLAEKRMVVIENILSGSDELLNELKSRIEGKKTPESNVVIFWQGEKVPTKGRQKKNVVAEELEQVLLKEKYVQDFSKLAEDKLLVWINQELKKTNSKISHPAALFLAHNVGDDMWALSGLLEQLSLYAKSKEIGLSDVQLFLGEKADDNAFNLVEAIVSGNHKLAFKLMSDQESLGEDKFKIFGLIVWQFRLLLQMRSLFDSEDGLTSDKAAAKLKIHPFVARKNWTVIKKYPLATLKEIYNQLLEIDIKTKTGQGDQSMLLDLFVGKN